VIVICLLSHSPFKVQQDSVTYQIGTDAYSRGNFARDGKLGHAQVSGLGLISDDFVFAISRDLGTIQATQDPVVWAIGYTTDPVISYSDLSGVPQTSRSPYYKIQYSNDEELASIYGNSQEDNMSNIKSQILDFLNDFSNATSRAQIRGDKMLQDAESVTYLLGGSVIMASSEVFGSMQLTIGSDAYGNLNESDVMIFMKNIGGSNAK
jgi:hypothetical protein